jgi:ABC-2 type transport system permease protein
MSRLASYYLKRVDTCLAVLAQYRASLVIWTLALIVEPVVYMAVWTLVARDNGTVGGFNMGEFAAYYLTWIVVRHFTVAIRPDSIEKRVQKGDFSPLLILPLHPIHADIADILGLKLFVMPTVLITVLLLAVAFPPTFNLQWWSIPAFLLAMVLAFPIRFLFAWLLGLVAFWTIWARSIYGVFTLGEIFLTGRLAPLPLLPGWAQILASFLPFRWMMAFPVEVLLGKLPVEEVLTGIAIQVVAVILLALLLDMVWRAAVRRYAAVGG